jgi:hypothetical protein
LLEVVGQRRSKLHPFAREGMLERQRVGVQQLPLQAGDGVGEVGRPVARGLAYAAVQRVADNGMPHRAGVDAHLVRASRLQPRRQQRAVAERLLHHKVRACGARLACQNRRCVQRRHLFALHRVASNRQVYREVRLARRAPHQRAVLALDGVSLQRAAESRVCAVGLGDHQQPCGVLVQPMHDARAEARAALREGGAVRQQRVDQRAVRMPRRRMHGQPARLVHHQQVVVLVDDGHRDGFGREVVVGRAVGRQRVVHRVARAQAVGRLRDGLPVDAHLTRRNPLLPAGAADVGVSLAQVAV